MDDSQPRAACDDVDHRLYVPHADGWQARILSGSEKVYCYYQNPGEAYHHLILAGEVCLARADEMVCLNCALRHGIATANRLYWQDSAHKQNRISSGL